MKRVSNDEILKEIQSTPLKELGKKAFDIKRELHSDKISTFVIDRNINYTNICWVDCKFCAFSKNKKRPY